MSKGVMINRKYVAGLLAHRQRRGVNQKLPRFSIRLLFERGYANVGNGLPIIPHVNSRQIFILVDAQKGFTVFIRQVGPARMNEVEPIVASGGDNELSRAGEVGKSLFVETGAIMRPGMPAKTQIDDRRLAHFTCFLKNEIAAFNDVGVVKTGAAGCVASSLNKNDVRTWRDAGHGRIESTAAGCNASDVRAMAKPAVSITLRHRAGIVINIIFCPYFFPALLGELQQVLDAGTVFITEIRVREINAGIENTDDHALALISLGQAGPLMHQIRADGDTAGIHLRVSG